jgi:hypothetical protein
MTLREIVTVRMQAPEIFLRTLEVLNESAVLPR